MNRKELIDELVRRANVIPADVPTPQRTVRPGHHKEIWQKRPNTVALIGLWYNDVYFFDFGFTKVRYPDKWDAERGKQLAVHKACAAIAKQILPLTM